MWKFQNFSVSQILREINFGDSRSAKYAILTHVQALKFDFHEFLHYLKAEIDQMNKFRALRIAKHAISTHLEALKFDFS